MSKHDPEQTCEHEMKFCAHCDVAYCSKCEREWGARCLLPHFPVSCSRPHVGEAFPPAHPSWTPSSWVIPTTPMPSTIPTITMMLGGSSEAHQH